MWTRALLFIVLLVVALPLALLLGIHLGESWITEMLP